MRVKEYVDYIKQGYILPKSKPTVKLNSTSTSMIDGNKSFGVLVSDNLARKYNLAKEEDLLKDLRQFSYQMQTQVETNNVLSGVA